MPTLHRISHTGYRMVVPSTLRQSSITELTTSEINETKLQHKNTTFIYIRHINLAAVPTTDARLVRDATACVIGGRRCLTWQQCRRHLSQTSSAQVLPRQAWSAAVSTCQRRLHLRLTTVLRAYIHRLGRYNKLAQTQCTGLAFWLQKPVTNF